MTNSLMLGTTLVSFYWLFAASLYVENSPVGATVVLVLGLVLLKRAAARSPLEVPHPARGMFALILAALVVASVGFPMPYRAGPVLALAGLVGWRLYGERHARTRPWWHALAFGGFVLICQSLVVPAYLGTFAADHPLPSLRWIVYWLLRAFGHDAVVGGTTIFVPLMRDLHSFPVTSERLGLYALSMVFVGFLVVVASAPATRRSAGRAVFLGLIAAAVYAVLRYAGMISAYLYLMHRMGYYDEVNRVDIFWNPWWTALTFVPLAWLFTALAPKGKRFDWLEYVLGRVPEDGRSLRFAAVSALLAAVAVLAAIAIPEPSTRKPGRVVIDEFHSEWEPTGRPYDTRWYGHGSGYNYAAIYDFLERHYRMDRLQEPITGGRLADCDVLILKVPTRPYEEAEIERVEEFVAGGGGVFLIGEHTNVFGTGMYLNDLARVLGFEFRSDCLFDTRPKTAGPEPFEQFYRPPRMLPHAIVEHVPMFLFQVSASIRPLNRFEGENVIVGTRLKSLPIDYHAENFYPQVVDYSDMDFGPFVEMWARYYGRGRVLAFGDSTCYSNFCAFQPGKPELLLASVEWLNHRNRFGHWKTVWMILGIVALLVAVISIAVSYNAVRVFTVVVFLLAAAVPLLTAAVRSINRTVAPLPVPTAPLQRVYFEREHGDYELPIRGFVRDHSRGFDLFYQWLMRLRVFPFVGETVEDCIEAGDVVVLIRPTKMFLESEVEALAAYVREGGALVLLDSPALRGEPSDVLLRAFGMRIDRGGQPYRGAVSAVGDITFTVDAARPVSGGEPLAWGVGGETLAAVKAFGEGRVVVATFADRFNDLGMGGGWQTTPTPNLVQVYEMQYALFRAALGPKTPPPPEPAPALPELPTTTTVILDRPAPPMP